MIGTDCIYSCKSNYYAVTTVPGIKGRHDRHEIGPPITKEIMTNNLAVRKIIITTIMMLMRNGKCLVGTVENITMVLQFVVVTVMGLF